MKNSLLALGLLAALPFAASAAENLSYNFVEGDYVRTPNVLARCKRGKNH